MITIDDPETERLAHELAARSGQSVEEAVRTALRARAARMDGAPTPAPSPWAILAELAGTVEMPADWAEEHDHYLYGVPKREQSR